MSNTGFQPTDSSFTQGGFQPDNQFSQTGFQPVTTEATKLDTAAIAAFTKGSAEAIPVGYDQGYSRGQAKKNGESDSGFSSTGFINTNESAEYGRGYAYGFSQGYALGYAQGLSAPAKFNNSGFTPETSNAAQ